MGNVAFVIDHKWAIISILVVLIILCWVLFGKKWSNVLKVFCAGTFSIVILDILFNWFEFYSKDSIDTLSAGFWNFIILIVSAPVAFAIWHFRDENNRQQIENQRKDINLKEFQKLSEWVSGAHLPEIKTISKTTNKYNLKNDAEIVRQSTLPIEYTTEETEEYSKQPKTADFDTFSKREGAVALQISAIYNLLPFFRGDYGESFRLPAFDLLKSTWQIMQQDGLKMFEKSRSVSELEQRAKSPLGIALTHVLLSSHKDNNQVILRDFYKILPSICLAGMDFNLGADESVAINLSDLNLNGVDFRGAVLRKVNFQKSKLHNAKFKKANLKEANFQNTELQFADLRGASLRKANLVKANLREVYLIQADLRDANLIQADLQDANLRGVNLQNTYFNWLQLKNSKAQLFAAQITVNDFIQKIYPDWKKADDSKWTDLTKDEQMKAMQEFCDETKMLIFDNTGTKQIMTPLKKHKTQLQT